MKLETITNEDGSKSEVYVETSPSGVVIKLDKEIAELFGDPAKMMADEIEAIEKATKV